MDTIDQIRRLQELSGVGADERVSFARAYNFAKDLPHEDDPTKWLDMMSSLIKLVHGEFQNGNIVRDNSMTYQQQVMKTAEVPLSEVEKIFNAYDDSGDTLEAFKNSM